MTTRQTPAAPAATPETDVATTVAPIPVLMTVEEVAKTLGRSPSTIYRAVQDGKLPPPRDIGGARRWLGREIAALIDEAAKS